MTACPVPVLDTLPPPAPAPGPAFTSPSIHVFRSAHPFGDGRFFLRILPGDQAAEAGWNWLSSVEPDSADSELSEPEITWFTRSK